MDNQDTGIDDPFVFETSIIASINTKPLFQKKLKGHDMEQPKSRIGHLLIMY